MNEKIFSFEQIHAGLTAAGLSAFLTEPLYLNGPAVLRAWLTGKIKLSAGPANSADAPLNTPHPNDLRLLETGPGRFLAIQPVTGITYSGASPQEEAWNWLFNTDRLHHTVARVAADPAITGLILSMNTPGGSVFGLHAAAAALQSLAQSRPGMPAAAWIQHDCCSAGMYLAAALPQIHAAPGARVGSIGTIASLSDWSGFQQKIGLETRTYTADSTLKNLGRGPISDAHDAYMQDMVGQYSKEFKAWMSARRGLTAADMHGQAWEARMAPAGMVDSAVCNTFEEFLAAGLL